MSLPARFRLQAKDAKTESDLRDLFSREIKTVGFHGFDAFAMLSRSRDDVDVSHNFFVCDYGMEIIQKFVLDKWLENDPVTAHIGRTSAPFEYVAFLKSSRINGSVGFQLAMLKLQQVSQAWCVPLNTIGTIRAVTVYMRGSSQEQTELFEAQRDDIHLAASHFMDRYCELHRTNQMASKAGAVDPARFSESEVTCLFWAAHGKTNWEIATIMSLSENTVRYHLKQVFRKLNVNSRTQAVTLALQAGLIEL